MNKLLFNKNILWLENVKSGDMDFNYLNNSIQEKGREWIWCRDELLCAMFS